MCLAAFVEISISSFRIDGCGMLFVVAPSDCGRSLTLGLVVEDFRSPHPQGESPQNDKNFLNKTEMIQLL